MTDHTDDRKVRSGRWRRVRGAALATAALAVWGAVVFAPVPASAARDGAPGATHAGVHPAAVGAPGQVPGEQPGVQRWLTLREGLQIELNNAIVAVRTLDRSDRAGATARCQRLLRVAGALTVFAGAPAANVDRLAKAGMQKFVTGAQACLGGNYDSALATIQAGLDERTAAQDALDATLMGH
ncbi:hypothetical protein [Pseudonocardia acidicola]|uniref:DUF5667 domain-containing protein n=1 Tax=Pseudonocardia acidicola TaxID=2724939 RepID=A0ABX1SEU2_9PSEU|nr:hypothetical protein [Pseudonocardia acidicola]NMI00071.1 hypothetical protein [Pseudonocardia acidicola]